MDGERRRPSLGCSVATAGRPAGSSRRRGCAAAAAAVALGIDLVAEDVRTGRQKGK
jgi:hypothetical protein